MKHLLVFGQQWLVASTDNKGKNSTSWAYLKHAGELDSASSMNSWSTTSHGKFANQPDVRVECLEESQCLKVLKSVPTRCALVLFVTPFVDVLSRLRICTFPYSFDWTGWFRLKNHHLCPKSRPQLLTIWASTFPKRPLTRQKRRENQNSAKQKFLNPGSLLPKLLLLQIKAQPLIS